MGHLKILLDSFLAFDLTIIIQIFGSGWCVWALDSSLTLLVWVDGYQDRLILICFLPCQTLHFSPTKACTPPPIHLNQASLPSLQLQALSDYRAAINCPAYLHSWMETFPTASVDGVLQGGIEVSSALHIFEIHLTVGLWGKEGLRGKLCFHHWNHPTGVARDYVLCVSK